MDDARHLTEEEVIRLLGEAQADQLLLGYVPEETRLVLEEWIEFHFGKGRSIEWLLLNEDELAAEWRERQRLRKGTEAAWQALNERIEHAKEQQARAEGERYETVEREQEANESIPRRRSLYAWVGVAASVLIAASVLLLIRLNPTKQPSATHVEIANDLAPAGKHAILKLGNGQQILLDTMGNKSFSIQGNTIVNHDSTLIYTKNKFQSGLPVTLNTLITPAGNEYRVTLPDGSNAWLNASSSVEYPTAFSEKTRDVNVTGEVYFEVVHNAKQPFRVHAGGLTIDDVGTAFNVKAYPGEKIVATLTQGKIKAAAGEHSSLLVPGQQVEMTRGEDNFTINKVVDTAESIAWKNGRFLFTDAHIKDILPEISRWYNVDVVDSSSVGIHFFISVPRKVPLSGLMKAIQRIYPLHYRLEDRKLILTP